MKASDMRELLNLQAEETAGSATHCGNRSAAWIVHVSSENPRQIRKEDALGQFGIGQAVRRKEDVRFITGAGRFTDDVSRPRQVYAYFLRSPHAHARLIAIDSGAAKAAPGILAVYTYADIAAAELGLIKCAAPVKNRDGSDYVNPGRPQLASDRVRHVGDP